MKKRTRIARWIFPFMSIFTCPLAIPLVIGWWYLPRRRPWAWWMLVGVYVVQAVMLSQIGPTKKHPTPIPWYAVAVMIAVLTIPALLILLTDRPWGWKPAAVPDEPIGACLKRRTRIVAWITVVLCGAEFLLSSAVEPLSFAVGSHKSHFTKDVALTLPVAIQFCFWTALLYERKWGWWGSVVFTFIGGLWGIWFIAFKPVHRIAGHEVYNSPQAMLVYGIMGLAFTALAMWILLTDRPRGWGKGTEEKPA